MERMSKNWKNWSNVGAILYKLEQVQPSWIADHELLSIKHISLGITSFIRAT